MRSFSLSAALVLFAACGGSTTAPASPPPPADDPADRITVVPRADARRAPPDDPQPCNLRAQLDAQVLTVTGGPIDARVPRTGAGGPIDAGAMKAALAACVYGGSAELAIAGEAPYQDIVDVMDAFLASGVQIALDAPDLPGLTQQPMLDFDVPAAGSGKTPLQVAPVLVIRGGKTGAIELRGAITGQPDVPIAVAPRPALDDAAVQTLYDALVAYRHATPTAGLLIIQADATTPSPAIYRAAGAAGAAGYGVLFAIKQR